MKIKDSKKIFRNSKYGIFKLFSINPQKKIKNKIFETFSNNCNFLKISVNFFKNFRNSNDF